MPSREKKKVSHPAPIGRNNTAATGRTAEKLPPIHIHPASNSTRINAFVSAQGRRNQAKRDAR